MTEEEKLVLICGLRTKKREKNLEVEVGDCESCGEKVMLESTPSATPEEADCILCSICGERMKGLRYGGAA